MSRSRKADIWYVLFFAFIAIASLYGGHWPITVSAAFMAGYSFNDALEEKS